MEQVTYTFKAQDKHNAKRFLTKTCKLDVSVVEMYLTQHEDAWGVWLDAAKQPVTFSTVLAAAEAIADAASAEAVAAQQAAAKLAEEQDKPPAMDAFAAFALGQLTGTGSTAPAPAGKAATSTGLKIEKNRAEQNGVIRPSAGTVCDKVWNLCASMSASLGKTVSLSALVAAAQLQNINQFTARTQYARWRKFIGATGRLDK